MGKRKAGPVRGYASVGHYLQGVGVLDRLPGIAGELGRKCAVLIDPYFYDALRRRLLDAAADDWDLEIYCAEKECSRQNIDALCTEFNHRFAPDGPDVLVGIGGGKTMDTMRGVAQRTGAALMEVPTSASTNAATSCLAVIYDERQVGKAVFLKKNPDYVLVDTALIAGAPARMLAAGIGDALATYYEARSCWAYNNENYVDHARGGLRPTLMGQCAAKACLETLLSNGREAFQAAQQGLVTDAFENTVEAIMLLSGIGWENNGTAIAHALVEGVPTVPDTALYLHGEQVAFCVLVQMLMDHDSEEDFHRIYTFCHDLHLPTCLRELGICEQIEEKVRTIIHRAFEIDPGITIANYPVDEELVFRSVMELDARSILQFH